MSEAKSTQHTPGPLHVGRRGLSPAVLDKQGRMLAEFPYHSSSRQHFVLVDEAIANATLYAAAPDLLKALSGWVEHLNAEPDGENDTPEYEMALMKAALSAIAKATQGMEEAFTKLG